MITQEILDTRFTELIQHWGIAPRLNMSAVAVRQLRFRSKRNSPIRLETKLKLLQRAGYRQEFVQYSDTDMLAFLKFYNESSEAAKSLGADYVLEKFKARPKPQPQLSFQF